MAWRKKSLGRKAALILHWIIAGSTAIFLIIEDLVCSVFPGRSVFAIGIVFGWMLLLFFEEEQRSKSGKDFTGALNLFVVMLIIFLEIVFTACERMFPTEMALTLLISLLNFILYYWPDIRSRLKRNKPD